MPNWWEDVDAWRRLEEKSPGFTEWANAYEREHGFMPGGGNQESLEQAISNRDWSRAYAGATGAPPTLDAWKAHYYRPDELGDVGQWWQNAVGVAGAAEAPKTPLAYDSPQQSALWRDVVGGLSPQGTRALGMTQSDAFRLSAGVAPSDAMLGGTGYTREQLEAMLAAEAERQGISDQLPVLRAIIDQESGWNPNAINAQSLATGLMQVMPKESSANYGGVFDQRPTQTELLDAATNIASGVAIFKGALEASGGDVKGALRQYSGGYTDDVYTNPVMAGAALYGPGDMRIGPDIYEQWGLGAPKEYQGAGRLPQTYPGEPEQPAPATNANGFEVLTSPRGGTQPVIPPGAPRQPNTPNSRDFLRGLSPTGRTQTEAELWRRAAMGASENESQRLMDVFQAGDDPELLARRQAIYGMAPAPEVKQATDRVGQLLSYLGQPAWAAEQGLGYAYLRTTPQSILDATAQQKNLQMQLTQMRAAGMENTPEYKALEAEYNSPKPFPTITEPSPRERVEQAWNEGGPLAAAKALFLGPIEGLWSGTPQERALDLEAARGGFYSGPGQIAATRQRLQAGEDTESVLADMQQYQNLPAELVGQSVGDPLNMTLFGIKPLTGALREREARFFVNPSTLTPEQEIAKVTAAALPTSTGGGILAGLNPLRPTTLTRRQALLNDSTNVLRLVGMTAEGPEDFASRVSLAITNPDLAAKTYGLDVLASTPGKRTVGFLRQLGDSETLQALVDAATKEGVEAGLDRRATGELISERLLQHGAKTLEKIVPEFKTAYERAAVPGQTVRNAKIIANNSIDDILHTAFMGWNPGYAWRNAANNFGTGIPDGILTFESAASQNRYLNRLGVTPARYSQGVGATGSKVLKGRDVAARASQWVEERFSRMYTYKGMRDTMDRLWPRSVMEQVGELGPTLPAPTRRQLMVDLSAAVNEREVRAAFIRAKQATRSLSPEMMTELAGLDGGLRDEILRIHRESPDFNTFRQRVQREVVPAIDSFAKRNSSLDQLVPEGSPLAADVEAIAESWAETTPPKPEAPAPQPRQKALTSVPTGEPTRQAVQVPPATAKPPTPREIAQQREINRRLADDLTARKSIVDGADFKALPDDERLLRWQQHTAVRMRGMETADQLHGMGADFRTMSTHWTKVFREAQDVLRNGSDEAAAPLAVPVEPKPRPPAPAAAAPTAPASKALPDWLNSVMDEQRRIAANRPDLVASVRAAAEKQTVAKKWVHDNFDAEWQNFGANRGEAQQNLVTFFRVIRKDLGLDAYTFADEDIITPRPPAPTAAAPTIPVREPTSPALRAEFAQEAGRAGFTATPSGGMDIGNEVHMANALRAAGVPIDGKVVRVGELTEQELRQAIDVMRQRQVLTAQQPPLPVAEAPVTPVASVAEAVAQAPAQQQRVADGIAKLTARGQTSSDTLVKGIIAPDGQQFSMGNLNDHDSLAKAIGYPATSGDAFDQMLADGWVRVHSPGRLEASTLDASTTERIERTLQAQMDEGLIPPKYSIIVEADGTQHYLSQQAFRDADYNLAETIRQETPGQALVNKAASEPPVSEIVTLPPEAVQAAERQTLGSIRVADIGIDPDRFQYKLVHGREGATGSLTDVKKWDANLAAGVQVWRDPTDGKLWVVNGHNRVALAKRLGVETMPSVHVIDVPTAEQARGVGALANIVNGRGTVVDAAKFFRDKGITDADLADMGISLSEKLVRDGTALGNLNDLLFSAVSKGEFPVERGVIIGSKLTDHAQQTELLRMIQHYMDKGRVINNDVVAELADMVGGAPRETATQATLFGAQEISRGNALERAELMADIRGRLGKDKRLFATAAANADALSRAGNVIDEAASRGISAESAQLLGIFDAVKNQQGEIGSIISDGAKRLAGGENAATVRGQVYEQVREALPRVLGGGEAPGAPSPSQAALFGAEGAPHATGQPAPTQGGLGLAAPSPATVPGAPIAYRPDMDIRNLDALSGGTGARYLVVVEGPDGAYVAKQWKRVPPKKLQAGETLIDFNPPKQGTLGAVEPTQTPRATTPATVTMSPGLTAATSRDEVRAALTAEEKAAKAAWQQAGSPGRLSDPAMKAYDQATQRLQAWNTSVHQGTPQKLTWPDLRQLYDKFGARPQSDILQGLRRDLGVVEPSSARLAGALGVGDVPYGSETEQRLRALVKGIVDDAGKNWNSGVGLPPAARKGLAASLDAAQQKAIRELNTAKTVAVKIGEATRDFALLDYSKRRAIDTLASAYLLYPYWMSRSLPNWGLRLLENPAVAASYLRYKKTLHEINKDLPEGWWREQLWVTLPGMSQPIAFNLERLLNPINGVMENWDDPLRRKNALGQAIQLIDKGGFSAHPIFSWVYSLDQGLRGDADAARSMTGYASTPTRVFKYVTGMLGLNDGKGITLEPWLWRGRPWTGADNYEWVRIARNLGTMESQGIDANLTRYAAHYMGTGELPEDPNLAKEVMATLDAAIRMEIEGKGPSNAVSWLFGAAVKPRNLDDMAIDRAQNELHAIYAANLDEDAFRDAMTGFYERYPWMRTVQLGRKSGGEAVYSWSWEVLNRIPPGQRTVRDQYIMGDPAVTGVTPEMLAMFRADKGFDNFTPRQVELWQARMLDLAAQYGVPAEGLSKEWQRVYDLNRQVYDEMDAQWPGWREWQDTYFKLRASDPEAASAYLATVPLQDAWSYKDGFIQDHPEYAWYYADEPRDQVIDTIWNIWNALEKAGLDRHNVRETLGEDFATKFLDPDTRDLDGLSNAQLLGWLAALGTMASQKGIDDSILRSLWSESPGTQTGAPTDPFVTSPFQMGAPAGAAGGGVPAAAGAGGTGAGPAASVVPGGTAGASSVGTQPSGLPDGGLELASPEQAAAYRQYTADKNLCYDQKDAAACARLDGAQYDAFKGPSGLAWSYYWNQIVPGWRADAFYNDPLIAKWFDPATRESVDIANVIARMKELRAAVPDLRWGDTAEYPQARSENEQWQEIAKQFMPRTMQYRQARFEFAQQHPVWAKYYVRDSELQSLGEYASRGWKYEPRSGGGGGGGKSGGYRFRGGTFRVQPRQSSLRMPSAPPQSNLWRMIMAPRSSR